MLGNFHKALAFGSKPPEFCKSWRRCRFTAGGTEVRLKIELPGHEGSRTGQHSWGCFAQIVSVNPFTDEDTEVQRG